jgi:hypothetical protein
MQFMNPMLARLASQRVAAEANARAVNPQHIAALQGQLQVGAGKMDESFNRGIVGSSAVNDALANRLNNVGGAEQQNLSAKLAQIGAADTGAVQQMYQGASNAGFASGGADIQRLISERAAGGAYQAKLPGIAALQGNKDLQQALSEMRSNFAEQEQGLQDQAAEQSFALWDKMRGEKREDAQSRTEALAAQQELYVKQKLAMQALAATATTNQEKMMFTAQMKELDRQNQVALAQIRADTSRYGVDTRATTAANKPGKPPSLTGPANQQYITVNGQVVKNPNYKPAGGPGRGQSTPAQARLKRNRAVSEINKIFFNPKTQKNRAWVESADTTWGQIAAKINASIEAAGITDPNVAKAIRIATYKRMGVITGPQGNPIRWAD